jgi:FKBP-type peptidyl-prolyl cis-trans isomerase
MKANKVIAVLIIGLSLAACTSKPAGDAIPKEFQPERSQVDSVSYLLGINFGSFIQGYDFGTDLNYGQILKGIKDFVFAKGDMQDPDFTKQFKVDPNEMNDLFNSYLEKRQAGVAQANKQKGEKFLADNAKKEGIIETASGLQYKIINPGSEVKPGPKDTVWVRYKGTLIDGTVFDEVSADDSPIRLTLNGVISGWTEGLQLIGEGGQIELYLPSDLAYGEQGNQAIGPNSTLIFNVELDSINPFVEPAPVQEQAKKK